MSQEIESAPQRTILRYPIPHLRDVSRDTQVRVEMLLRGHPRLYKLTVLPDPVLMTEAEAIEEQLELQREQMQTRQALPMMQLDLNRPDRDIAIQELIADRFHKNHGIAPELDVVIAALKADEGFAWTWHSNLAAAVISQGGNHAMANRAAATFLHMLGEIDTTSNPHYAATQPDLSHYQFQDSVSVAHTREQFYMAYYQHALDLAIESCAESDSGIQLTVAPPAGFPEVDQGHIQFPVAFRFGHSNKTGDPIVVSYIAQELNIDDSGLVHVPVPNDMVPTSTEAAA